MRNNLTVENNNLHAFLLMMSKVRAGQELSLYSSLSDLTNDPDHNADKHNFLSECCNTPL